MQTGKLKIENSDRCDHCGHWAGDADVPFRIVSERRFKWLLKAAEMLDKIEGDDDWLDWKDEDKKLKKEGE